MNPYYELLHTVCACELCSRFYLEHINRGKFKKMIDECIQRGYIECIGKNENGDDLYQLTTSGKRIVNNPKEVI